MKAIYILAMLVVVFVFMYDTRSGRLEKFMNGVQASQEKQPCCNNNDYMATNFTQCQAPHFQGVQFADTNYGCPERHPKVHGGAIFAP